ncbi:hypothetical protein JCM11251_007818 [Rhodosporidiobolus azoricus]
MQLFKKKDPNAPVKEKTPPVYLSWANNTNDCWWKDSGLRRNVLWAFIADLSTHDALSGPFVQGYDGAYFNALQIMPAFNNYFDTPKGSRLGLFTASTYFPLVALAPLQAMITDIIGRRLSIGIGSIILIAGSFVGCFANGEGMFIAGRVIVGLANGFVLFGTNLLLNEILHPRLRSVSSAIFFVFYYVGSSCASWFGYAAIAHNWDSDWSWRICTLLQGIGAVLLLVTAPFMPESPRWLISKGHKERAHKILAHYHANGKMDDELVMNELEEIESALYREKTERAGWSSFFATPGNRKRLAVLLLIGTGSQFNGNNPPAYFLNDVLTIVGITDDVIKSGINGGLALWNLIWAGLGASLVEHVGRRPLWIYSTAGMLVSYILLTGLSGGFQATQQEATGYASIAFIFFVYLFYDLSWTPLSWSYTIEILPFSLRAKGMSIFIWSQQCTLLFNCFVNPIALNDIGWKYYFVFIGTLIFYLTMAIFLFKETKGLSLEEVALVFDRPDNDRSDKKQAILTELRDPTIPSGTKFNGRAAEIRHLEDENDLAGEDDSVAPAKEKTQRKLEV